MHLTECRGTIVGRSLQLTSGAEPIAGYRLTRFLGRGGWGQVWRATAPDNQDVALKFLPCANQSSAAQEIRALQAVRQLHHPNLLKIYQVWSVADHLVISMELANGSLMDLLEVYDADFGTGIVAEHLCEYLTQVADALDFLNTRQHTFNDQRVAFRHCDVKPSNILILEDEVKLADFSLTVPTTSSYANYRRVGTLPFAGQEIFQGWLSEQSDQFALAVTYCVLRGKRFPFKDTPRSFVLGHVRSEPDLSMVSDAERPILAKALDSIPQNRWSNCLEMMARLSKSLKSSNVMV